MRSIAKRLSKFWQSPVILLAAAALVLSGLSAAERLYQPVNAEASIAVDTDWIGPVLPGPESDPGSMVPVDRPNTEQTACFVVPFVLKNDNPDNRLKTRRAAASRFDVSYTGRTDDSRAVASSCLVDSDLGRQFTLVGARPSGTS